MIKIYGKKPPGYLSALQVGGKCPHCNENSRFSMRTSVHGEALRADQAQEVVVSYSCDACLKAVPIYWRISNYAHNGNPEVYNPTMILPVVEKFDFDHVPEPIINEIKEALNCLSVEAHNGFAAISRRSVQAICDDLGAKGASKVQKQIEEMLEMTGLGDDWNETTKQILLTGHDGAHPHLPEVNQERAAILFSLLQDLTYQLYTRPGKVKEAAELRQKVIAEKNQ